MPRSLITVKEVAASLHLSAREVVRMAEQRILPAIRVKNEWCFRAGEIWNWVEANLHTLPTRRVKDKHPSEPRDLLLARALRPAAIAIDLPANTKASVLRELAHLAGRADPVLDAAALADALVEREAVQSTALQDGVAVPHPARPFYCEGPLVAAARTVRGIAFGERGGGLTDLFFLICCPQQVDHLLYLGRLCRLLIDKSLQQHLRAAAGAEEFAALVLEAEAELCRSK